MKKLRLLLLILAATLVAQLAYSQSDNAVLQTGGLDLLEEQEENDHWLVVREGPANNSQIAN